MVAFLYFQQFHLAETCFAFLFPLHKVKMPKPIQQSLYVLSKSNIQTSSFISMTACNQTLVPLIFFTPNRSLDGLGIFQGNFRFAHQQSQTTLQQTKWN